MRGLKRTLFALVALAGLFILVLVAAALLVDVDAYRPRLEKAASEALRMDVRAGRLRIGLFPGVQLELDDVQIRNRGAAIVSAKKASLDIALLPLLHGEVRIERIGLKGPHISIRRGRDGRFNFEPQEKVPGMRPGWALHRLSLSGGTFLYEDEETGGGVRAEEFTLDVRDILLPAGRSEELLTRLSFTAECSCREMRMKEIALSNVKFTCTGKEGRFALDPVTLRLFGGQGSASIKADFSGPASRYTIRAAVSKFRIEAYLKTLSPKRLAEGSMDFTASLAMRGNTVKEMTRSADGEVSLRGENLTLYGTDLDRAFERFESSQRFSLLDAGAYFFVGPFGLAVTKAYNFASLLQESGGKSGIVKLFSDWKVGRGIADARDVAMATRLHRIALKGKIDFVDERFDGVTMAVVDSRGCARVKQKIHGSLQKPVVEKPSLLRSLAGPALNLLDEARDLLTGQVCEPFYSGSVRAPR